MVFGLNSDILERVKLCRSVLRIQSHVCIYHHSLLYLLRSNVNCAVNPWKVLGYCIMTAKTDSQKKIDISLRRSAERSQEKSSQTDDDSEEFPDHEENAKLKALDNIKLTIS